MPGKDKDVSEDMPKTLEGWRRWMLAMLNGVAATIHQAYEKESDEEQKKRMMRAIIENRRVYAEILDSKEGKNTLPQNENEWRDTLIRSKIEAIEALENSYGDMPTQQDKERLKRMIADYKEELKELQNE